MQNMQSANKLCLAPMHTSDAAKHIFQLRETVQQRLMLIILKHKYQDNKTLWCTKSIKKTY